MDWFIEWVNKKIYVRNLPKESDRTLKKTLNSMRDNLFCLLWNVLWGVLVFTLIIVGLNTMNPMEFLKDALWFVAISGPIFLGGNILGKIIHEEKDCTKNLLKRTFEIYDYGDENQKKLFREHLEWSLRNNMLVNSKNIVVTEEFLVGSASDTGFCPVAISRIFVKKAEVRTTYSQGTGKNGALLVCDAHLVCELMNGDEIAFLLGRGESAELVEEKLNDTGWV